MDGGAIPDKLQSGRTGVAFRVPVIIRQEWFNSVLILCAWQDLAHTGELGF